MNYQALKSMLDNVLESFSCPECNTKIKEENIDIIWAAWTNLNLDIVCPKCWRHTMMKSQVLTIDLSSIWFFKNIKKSNKLNAIKDEEVIKLSKELKNRKLKASDLFSE